MTTATQTQTTVVGAYGLTHEAINLSGGVVRKDEYPLYLGTSKFMLAHKPLKMSVTQDDEWFWVRFPLTREGQQLLTPEMQTEMAAHGGQYSKRKRLGWWFNQSPASVAFLRELGYRNAKLPDTEMVVTPAQQAEHDAEQLIASMLPPELAAKYLAAVTPAKPTPAPTNDVPQEWAAIGIHRNTRNRLVDSEGRFITAARATYLATQGKGKAAPPLMEETTPPVVSVHVAPPVERKPTLLPVEPARYAPQTDHGKAMYDYGISVGQSDGVDESKPAVYDRMMMAKVLNTTIDALQAKMGSAFIQGYLEGFEEVRPKPSKPLSLSDVFAAMSRKD